MLEQIVCQPSRSIRELDVGAAKHLVVCCNVVDCFGVWFDFSCAGEEECWGELVDVVVMFVGIFGGGGGGGKDMREEGCEAGGWR